MPSPQHPPKEECTLLISTVQGSAFKGLVECLRDISFDCSMSFEPIGVAKISTMDGARCSLIHAELKNFELFHCPSPMEFGLNLQISYSTVFY